jgi:hypothetical protein
MGKMKAGPVVSDNGNFIIDAPFPESMMKDPVEVSSPFIFRRGPWLMAATAQDQDVHGCSGGWTFL